MEISEERKTPQSENMLHHFMILATLVNLIKVDGVGLAAGVYLYHRTSLKTSSLLKPYLTTLRECGSGEKTSVLS